MSGFSVLVFGQEMGKNLIKGMHTKKLLWRANKNIRVTKNTIRNIPLQSNNKQDIFLASVYKILKPSYYKEF